MSKNWLSVVSVIFSTTPTAVASTQAAIPPGLNAGMRPGRNSIRSRLARGWRRR